jgi:hypothetical protein
MRPRIVLLVACIGVAAGLRVAPTRPAPRRSAPPSLSLAQTVPFEEWAESNGIDAPKLAVTGKEELRGVIVLEDIEEGDELCCVPRTSCLDLTAVEGAGSPCEELVPTSLWATLRWYERLACWLLAEVCSRTTRTYWP